MKKRIIITYDEADENFLMTFFKKLKVKTKALDPKTQVEIVKKRLHDKYVLTGEWTTMTEEERENAAHAETMIFNQEQPEHHVYSAEDTKSYRQKMRKKLLENANH